MVVEIALQSLERTWMEPRMNLNLVLLRKSRQTVQTAHQDFSLRWTLGSRS